ncbi:MAG TPA: type 1 glutamine amidotransferase [Hanamia sp.]|nr:type 1 glutamine amidotransferase [Hanamia sp.]
MKHLRIHYLQHVSFEGLGNIEEWATVHGHKLSVTKLYMDAVLPTPDSFDWLIIMGGPMSVYDEQKYSWLIAEKQFIKQAIAANKTVIGICLGSQLLAEALGAKVYPNEQKEIGWFPIEFTSDASSHSLFSNIKIPKTVFHWHGDTFDLPPNAIHLAHSKACKNQAFLFNKKVLGLQFHLEMSEIALRTMIENGRSELIEAKYIQSEAMILSQKQFIEPNRKILFSILNTMTKEE